MRPIYIAALTLTPLILGMLAYVVYLIQGVEKDRP